MTGLRGKTVDGKIDGYRIARATLEEVIEFLTADEDEAYRLVAGEPAIVLDDCCSLIPELHYVIVGWGQNDTIRSNAASSNRWYSPLNLKLNIEVGP